MEEIKINEIIEKPTGLVIVKYNTDGDATLNRKWQNQEVDYLLNEVGVGGRVLVKVEQKGIYKNITTVNMTSGFKGPSGNTETSTITERPSAKAEAQSVPMFSKDKSIVAQCLIKCAVESVKGEAVMSDEAFDKLIAVRTQALIGTYKLAVSLL